VTVNHESGTPGQVGYLPDPHDDLDEAWKGVQPETARRLLRSAVECFAQRGYHATTTRDIAAGAALSTAGVYVYFRSKEELFYRLARTGHDEALELMRAVIATRRTPAEQLAGIVSGYTAWQARRYKSGRVVVYELSALTPDHQAEIIVTRQEIDSIVRDVLNRGVADGSFAVTDIPGTALAIMSLAVDVSRWYGPGLRRQPEDVGRLYAELALRMVGAGSAGSTGSAGSMESMRAAGS
jgi:AcrR family transcriptional regulator